MSRKMPIAIRLNRSMDTKIIILIVSLARVYASTVPKDKSHHFTIDAAFNVLPLFLWVQVGQNTSVGSINFSATIRLPRSRHCSRRSCPKRLATKRRTQLYGANCSEASANTHTHYTPFNDRPFLFDVPRANSGLRFLFQFYLPHFSSSPIFVLLDCAATGETHTLITHLLSPPVPSSLSSEGRWDSSGRLLFCPRYRGEIHLLLFYPFPLSGDIKSNTELPGGFAGRIGSIFETSKDSLSCSPFHPIQPDVCTRPR